MHLIEAVDAGRGLLGDALDGGEALGVPARLRRDPLLDGGVKDALLLAAGLVEDVDSTGNADAVSGRTNCGSSTVLTRLSLWNAGTRTRRPEWPAPSESTK